MQNYYNDFLSYTQSNSVKSECADITFINQGNSSILLNNALTLSPGQSVSFSANENELDKTIYNFVFQKDAPQDQWKLIVLRKMYI